MVTMFAKLSTSNYLLNHVCNSLKRTRNICETIIKILAPEPRFVIYPSDDCFRDIYHGKPEKYLNKMIDGMEW